MQPLQGSRFSEGGFSLVLGSLLRSTHARIGPLLASLAWACMQHAWGVVGSRRAWFAGGF